MSEEVQEEKESKKLPFALPKRKVKVVPIVREGAWVEPHKENSFLFGNGRKRYGVPLIGDERVATILTDEERSFLEKEIDRDLNPMKKVKDNYWMNRFAILTKDIKHLDLSDPQDFIDYKILLSNTEDIVEGGDNKYAKPYKYFIDDVAYESKQRSKSATAKKEAYKVFGQLTSKGKTAMIDFITVFYQNKPGKRVPDGATIEWLESEIDTIIEKDIEVFLGIATDPDYDDKLFITKAIRKRAILKEGNTYMLPETGLIAKDLNDLILWLRDDLNQDLVFQVKQRIQDN